jgi:hypothetical protein
MPMQITSNHCRAVEALSMAQPVARLNDITADPNRVEASLRAAIFLNCANLPSALPNSVG